MGEGSATGLLTGIIERHRLRTHDAHGSPDRGHRQQGDGSHGPDDEGVEDVRTFVGRPAQVSQRTRPEGRRHLIFVCVCVYEREDGPRRSLVSVDGHDDNQRCRSRLSLSLAILPGRVDFQTQDVVPKHVITRRER